MLQGHWAAAEPSHSSRRKNARSDQAVTEADVDQRDLEWAAPGCSRDLLGPEADNLQVGAERRGGGSQCVLPGAAEAPLASPGDLAAVLGPALAGRVTARTAMNTGAPASLHRSVPMAPLLVAEGGPWPAFPAADGLVF